MVLLAKLVLRALPVLQAKLDLPVLLVKLDLLALRVLLAQMVQLVQPGKLDKPVKMV